MALRAFTCGEFLSRLPKPLKSIAVSIAPQGSTEVRRYGIIGGTLEAVDKLIKRLSQPTVELRFVYEAGPCGFVLCPLCSPGAHTGRRSKDSIGMELNFGVD